MTNPNTLGISFKYESRSLFRNVRPVNNIIDDFTANNIPYVKLDSEKMQYGSWDLIIAFSKQENYERFVAGELSVDDLWIKADKGQEHVVNPLKAAKRAAAGN
ncbi:hypothetical protein SAMN05660420_00256 [Desulfuromusa kysingii]|uniref:Uncharacterized protein n=1 Tax=Desulfuromusa kysingii TaxID=37625 RepID=A0A1H3VSE0_9BACT|nr:hypothetical protein [Desulfuromusa kysingii]SDZ77697.1 hypothetical protein SAMN05660420_00256 [Desulfuromusa kysingii]